MSSLHNLPPVVTGAKKRLGRGTGSGKGNHTVGRGQKGQTSRTGRSIPLWFEGGQLPLIKRLPFQRGKLRFKSLNKTSQLVSLTQLSKLKVKEVTPAVLKENKLVKSAYRPIKITGEGELSGVYEVTGIKATQKAKELIEKAGGKIN